MDMSLATVLPNPKRDWRKVVTGGKRIRVARNLEVDWKKFNQDEYLFSHCFPAGTMILLGDGTEKPIEDIEIGDEVISHTGMVRKVTKSMKREVDEEIISIKSASLEKVSCTQEHPFYAIRKEDSWCSFNRGHKKCTFGFSKKCAGSRCRDNGSSPEFIEARELRVGDRTFTPSLKAVREGNFTKEQMRLLGYYVSEGRVDTDVREGIQDSVRFSIHRDELEGEMGKEICELMSSCFGVDSHGTFGNNESNGVTISFSSDKASAWFIRHAGLGSKEKKFSVDVVQAEPELQVELLHTWSIGDGSFDFDDRILRICTASDDLASQAEVMFDRIGGLAITHKMKNSGGPTNREKECWINHVSVRCSNMGMIKDRFDEREYARWPRTGKRYRHAACAVSEITSIEHKQFKGTVYNFSVEKDESYIANRCAVHNCTIVASVATEDNGYYIDPVCTPLVNNNGNAWTNEVLMATFRTFCGAENYLEHCFPAGTRVLMADGTYKPIEEVKPGERVVNRLGEPSVVKNIQIRKSKEFVTLDSKKILSRKLRVTGNHPLWVMKARDACPKTGRLNNPPRKKENPNPEWSGYSVGVHGKSSEQKPCGWEQEWVNADDFNEERHALTLPVSSYEVQSDEMTNNRAELIGWFLAEGSYVSGQHREGETGIQFALSANESHVAERLSSLLTKEFGHLFRSDAAPRTYEVEYRGKPSSLILTLSNVDVAQFFLKWCGKYSWAKKMPEEAMWLPVGQQSKILYSYLCGDGCDNIDSRGYVAGTASRSLAHQMSFIANRLGLHPTIKEDYLLPRYSECIDDGEFPVYMEPETGRKRRPEHIVRMSMGDSIRLDNLNGKETKFVASKSSKSSNIFFDKWFGFWAEKGQEATQEEVAVFNLEVEDDNSYIAEGVAVHNCQIPELSKGKILDAVLRPVKYKGENGKTANVYYCDILVATNRRHDSLVRKIASGKLTTMSMGCFLAGTRVTMADGTLKEIQNVESGEMVLSHTGKKRKVTQTIKTHWHGDVYKIYVTGCPEPIVCTGNHKFYHLSGRDDCLCGCGEKLPHSINASGRRSVLSSFIQGHKMRVMNPMVSYSEEERTDRQAVIDMAGDLVFNWTSARELKRGDLLCHPSSKNDDEFEIDSKARLLGLYLAEGSLVKQRGEYKAVEFSFSLSERDTLAEETRGLLMSELGVPSSIYIRPKSNQCQVRTSWSKDAVNWFKSMAGHYSWGKRLNKEVMEWGDNSIKSLIGGWLDGDGCLDKKNRGRIVAATVSDDLASQMRVLMCRLGVYHTWRKEPASESEEGGIIVCRREAHYLTIPKSHTVEVVKWTSRWADEDVIMKKPEGQSLSDDNVLFRVDRIECVREMDGDNDAMDVFCLEVDEDHSFVVQGAVAAENCLAHWVQCSKCGKVLGDNDQNCPCLDRQIMTTFRDEKGIERIVAELCGRVITKDGKRVGDSESVKFIEASWVEKPAFVGAVLNHYISELPQAAAMLDLSTPALEMKLEDLFAMRVADRRGMIILNVARAEILRRKHIAMVERVAGVYA